MSNVITHTIAPIISVLVAHADACRHLQSKFEECSVLQINNGGINLRSPHTALG